MNILQTSPTQDYVAVFIDVNEGYPYVIPVILWATVRDENHRDSIVGVLISESYTPELILLSDNSYRHFWRYEHKDAEWDHKEIEQEVEFCRGYERESLTEDFLFLAIKENIISKELAVEFCESLPYPFLSAKGKPVYGAYTIATILEIEGLRSWQDRLEDNEIIKKMFKEWHRWHRDEKNFSFLKDKS